MGLLDDAIREHLELKRRRGADPSEVARQQREALAPVPGAGETMEEGGPEGAAEPRADELVEPMPAHGVVGEEHPTEAHEVLQPVPGAEAANHVEETGEIDMEMVLDHDVAGPSAAEPEQRDVMSAQPVAHPDDERDWERSHEYHSPDEQSEPPREIPGQERMSFE